MPTLFAGTGISTLKSTALLNAGAFTNLTARFFVATGMITSSCRAAAYSAASDHPSNTTRTSSHGSACGTLARLPRSSELRNTGRLSLSVIHPHRPQPVRDASFLLPLRAVIHRMVHRVIVPVRLATLRAGVGLHTVAFFLRCALTRFPSSSRFRRQYSSMYSRFRRWCSSRVRADFRSR